MQQTFNNIEKVKGELTLTGDKSISHRAVIFSSMADGKSLIKNLSNGEDVNTTIRCFRHLGIEIQKEKNETIIFGRGVKGFNKSVSSLDCGNSGTTARLIAGLLSAQDFGSTLTGDESLSKRPMDRVIVPLKQMGAKIESNNKYLPLKIFPSVLNQINYELSIPSAQIKSSVILAGLHCDGTTSIVEKVPSRNHTENMLGLDIKKSATGNTILVSGKNYPVPAEYFIPSDVSSAAFFVVLALLTKGSSLIIKNVSLNETRKGYLKILEVMGAKMNYEKIKVSSGEVYGDIIVQSSSLKNTEIPEE
ncbi:MAG TPA: 3-phosphoshikimate 1-carboxyvinyltransferase, partial [Ignavibacteriaceae bacterium]